MSHAADHESASRKIFIGGLSYSTDEDKLRDYFEKFGPVQDAVVMKDPVTKRSRGFGFITFDASIYVDIALEQDVHMIDSRKVEAKRAVPRSDVPGSAKESQPAAPPTASPKIAPNPVLAPAVHSPAIADNRTLNNSSSSNADHGSSKYSTEDYAYHKIFVGGLHYDTRDAEFRAYFELYGRVLSAEVMFNRETHKSRGFGFIIFELESSVDLVCDERDHIIDGKMVEVKRAVPRTKGPTASSGAPKAHAQPAVAKPSSAQSVSAPAKPVVTEATIGVKKVAALPAKTATNVAIASVGMRSKPTPAKSATTSYAAALRAGNNNTSEPENPLDPLENEYPPLASAKANPATANGSPRLEPNSSGNESIAQVLSSSQHSTPKLPGASPGVIASPMMQSSHYPIMSNNSRNSPTTRDHLTPPNLVSAIPSMMLPQSVLPQGQISYDQKAHQQIPLPGPPQRGYTQPQSHHEFETFDMNRPVRALSESFVPPSYGNKVPGLSGYYGNVMDSVSTMRDPFLSSDVSSYPQQQRSDSLGDLSGGHVYENHMRGLPQAGHGSYDSTYGFTGGNPGQFNMHGSGQLGGLSWLPVSLSSSTGPSQGSELDAAGEDAIGLGLALSMDLNDIRPQSQFGSSRVVSGEGRFDSHRSRGPAPSYLPSNNSGPTYGSNNSLGGWNVNSNIQVPPSVDSRNNMNSYVGAVPPPQEWYPQLNDLRSTAAEFRPTSSSSSSVTNNVNGGGTMSWDLGRQK